MNRFRKGPSFLYRKENVYQERIETRLNLISYPRKDCANILYITKCKDVNNLQITEERTYSNFY